MSKKWRVAVAALTITLISPCSFARPLTGGERWVPEAYRSIASKTGVPVRLLYAVALAESGMRVKTGSFRPFPWTLVVRGKAQRFTSRAETVTEIKRLLSAGVTNVDVGIMQTNMHWHGYRYSSPEQAVDPWVNVLQGASILAEEKGSSTCKGDWWCAVARYHSYRKADGQRYAKRVKHFHEQLSQSR